MDLIKNLIIKPIVHSELCKKYFLSLSSLALEQEIILHENNNCTVDEAIHFGKYFKNSTEQIIIITNDWHIERVKYLFNMTFRYYKIKNYHFDYTNTDLKPLEIETLKLQQLKNSPYGTLLQWINLTKNV